MALSEIPSGLSSVRIEPWETLSAPHSGKDLSFELDFSSSVMVCVVVVAILWLLEGWWTKFDGVNKDISSSRCVV